MTAPRAEVNGRHTAASVREIAAALGLLIGPDQRFEIRAILRDKAGAVSRIFAPGEIDAAARYTAELSTSGRYAGIYYALNAIKPGPIGGKGAADNDVLRRRLLLVDLDPRRPADTSATDGEKGHALTLADGVTDFLRERGFPDPVVIDSGNGVQLIFAVDLPNDGAARALTKVLLEGLAGRFNSAEVEVDTKVHNASRISKVPGTWARKGESTGERPHRLARILKAPDELVVVPEDRLLALAEELGTAGRGQATLDLEEEIERERTQGGERLKVPGHGDEWTPERRAAAYLEKCEPAVSGRRGHDKAFKAAVAIGPGFDLPPAVALDLLRRIYNPRCEPPWSEKELRHKVDDAYAKETRRGWLLDATRTNGRATHNGHLEGGGEGGPETPADGTPSGHGRRPIEVNTERHRVLAETLAVLPSDPDLFRRGDVLVRVAREEEDTARLAGGIELRKARGGARAVVMGEAGLSCRLTSLADFYSWSRGKNREEHARPVHPPGWLVGAVAENATYPGVRPLRGLAEVPFPRADGSLVTTPGYDDQTGVFYSPTISIGPIPDSPTRADAEAAANRLFALVEQFPFATEDDKAVWLAALVTALARPAIEGPVPGTAFNGNASGVGKGKLVDAIATVASDRPAPTTSYPRDETEADKIKVAFALAATPIIHLDNLDEGRSYGGGVLDSALTSMTVSGRILGQSRTTEGLDLRCCWFISGNNISPTKDGFRRWLVCNLVTDLERPEERNDLKIPDLLGYVREHRAALVRDALIVLRAHAAAGFPRCQDKNGRDTAPLGSFEQWDRIVRGAVWFATGRDCNTTRRKAAEESPDRLNKLALLEAWSELPNGSDGGLGVTSEEAHRLAFGDKDNPARYPALGEVLMRFSRDGKVSTRNIGFILRGMRGQNFNGRAFRTDRDLKRSALWYVEKLYPDSPNRRRSGEYGEHGEYCSDSSQYAPQRTYDMI
jgi:hypothetical protein